MDSVIEQLQNSRTLIRARIASIERGGRRSERRIGAEFDALRRAMAQREQSLVEGLRQRVRRRLSGLSSLDHDVLRSVQRVQRSKVETQSLMETEYEPRVCRRRWRAFSARKEAVALTVEAAMKEAVHRKEAVAELVADRMAMDRTTKPFLLSAFTKNSAQILLESKAPGFAAHFGDRAAVHRVCTEHDALCPFEPGTTLTLSLSLCVFVAVH